MKHVRQFVTSTLVGGLFVVVPVYLAVLLLLKGMKSVAGLVQPVAALLPEWIPAPNAALPAAGAVRSVSSSAPPCALERGARLASAWRRCSSSELPGYDLLRSLTQRLAGDGDEDAWKPALAEIEDALVPAFVIEELADGRLTIFVPSVPTPFAGAVYILDRERVHVRRRPLHPGHQVRLALGRGVEGPGGGDAGAATDPARPQHGWRRPP